MSFFFFFSVIFSRADSRSPCHSPHYPRPSSSSSLFAGVFLVAAIYMGFNEGPANWQSLWTCAVYILLAVTLWQARA